jgi:glycine hydroxymethyltransferase
MQTILFICSGNICRSPMAEGLLKKLLLDKKLEHKITACSAGTLGITGASASENAIVACHLEYDVDISLHESQPITDDLLEESDLIFCMAQKHIDHVKNYYDPGYSRKIYLLKQYAEIPDNFKDVADPIGMDLSEYTKTCHEISALLQSSMEKIIKTLI